MMTAPAPGVCGVTHLKLCHGGNIAFHAVKTAVRRPALADTTGKRYIHPMIITNGNT